MLERFGRVGDVNLFGLFHVTQLALVPMLARGRGPVVQITTTLVER